MKPKRWWCTKCAAELTEADVEAGMCTQCKSALPLTQPMLDLHAPEIKPDFRIGYDKGKAIQQLLLEYRSGATGTTFYELITELAKEFD